MIAIAGEASYRHRPPPIRPKGNDGEQLLAIGVGVGAGAPEAAGGGGATVGTPGAGLSTAAAGWGAMTGVVVGALAEADGNTDWLGPVEALELPAAVGRETAASPSVGGETEGLLLGRAAALPPEGVAPEAAQRKPSPGHPVTNNVRPRETASTMRPRPAQTSGRPKGAGRVARRRPVLVRRSRRLSPSELTAASRLVRTPRRIVRILPPTTPRGRIG
jgi:hypothetical protein